MRQALARVTVDEGRHAELAWRFIQWVLKSEGLVPRRSVARLLVQTIERELLARASGTDSECPKDDSTLLAHGILGVATHRALRLCVLVEIVLPCARALVRSLPDEPELGDFKVDIPVT